MAKSSLTIEELHVQAKLIKANNLMCFYDPSDHTFNIRADHNSDRVELDADTLEEISTANSVYHSRNKRVRNGELGAKDYDPKKDQVSLHGEDD